MSVNAAPSAEVKTEHLSNIKKDALKKVLVSTALLLSGIAILALSISSSYFTCGGSTFLQTLLSEGLPFAFGAGSSFLIFYATKSLFQGISQYFSARDKTGI